MEQTRTQCCLPQVLSFIAGGVFPFCSLVIRRLREALGPTKTISFTKLGSFFIGSYSGAVVDTVIAAAHHYLDYITGDLDLQHSSRKNTDLQCKLYFRFCTGQAVLHKNRTCIFNRLLIVLLSQSVRLGMQSLGREPVMIFNL